MKKIPTKPSSKNSNTYTEILPKIEKRTKILREKAAKQGKAIQ